MIEFLNGVVEVIRMLSCDISSQKFCTLHHVDALSPMPRSCHQFPDQHCESNTNLHPFHNNEPVSLRSILNISLSSPYKPNPPPQCRPPLRFHRPQLFCSYRLLPTHQATSLSKPPSTTLSLRSSAPLVPPTLRSPPMNVTSSTSPSQFPGTPNTILYLEPRFSMSHKRQSLTCTNSLHLSRCRKS